MNKLPQHIFSKIKNLGHDFDNKIASSHLECYKCKLCGLYLIRNNIGHINDKWWLSYPPLITTSDIKKKYYLNTKCIELQVKEILE
jgi:hypothetical protein